MRTVRASLVLVFGLLLAGGAHLTTQAALVPIEGTFTFVAEESDDIDRAIREATSRMNFITRGVARGRLARTNQAYQTITITQTAEQVTITTDARAPIVTPTDGTPVEWRREDGEVFNVSSMPENGGLRQSFVAEDGRRENVYSVSPDGHTLTMRVTVSSGRLPQSLTYTLRFRRAS